MFNERNLKNQERSRSGPYSVNVLQNAATAAGKIMIKFTGIAKEDLEAKGLPLKNKVEFENKGYALPDVSTIRIGRKNLDTGEYESFFLVDTENSDTKQFDECRKQLTTLLEEERTIYDEKTGEEKHIMDYYVPYDIQESSKNLPTVTESHVDGAYIANGYYRCEVEILLSCDDATRRIVIPYNSVNATIYDFMKNIESSVEYVFEGEADDDEAFLNILEEKDEIFYLKMFKETGREISVEIESIFAFTSMIVSIRQIRCDFVRDAKRLED